MVTLTLTRSADPDGQRQDHDKAAIDLFAKARDFAESGQIKESGSLILEALRHERRAGHAGPQVLQIIKPRG